MVEKANRARVYIVSPTTLWAVLHTMRAVLKDVRMREQAGEIQKMVGHLLNDVRLLDERAEKLQSHFDQTSKDVRDIRVPPDSPRFRGYKTAGKLTFHTDTSDVTALFVLRAAKAGGRSLVSSSIATHNEILRRRPEVRHRRQAADLLRLADLQAQILRQAAKLLRPGGVLVHATCSMAWEEGPLVVDAFLGDHPAFERDPGDPAWVRE